QARRFAEADDLVRGERARTEAALVAAAVDLRLDANAGLSPHVKGADALRAVDLVRRDGKQVDLELLHVDLDAPGALHRIAVEDDALRAAQLADLPHRLDHADLVVHHHDRNQDGVRPNGFFKAIQINEAVLHHFQIRGLEALALELAEGVEHGLMLVLLRDDVLALGL